jgi:predicted RNA-binding Zn ribbon-like protein
MTETIDTVELVGGDLAFDLVNTASARRDGPFRERLLTYDDLVRWAERVELLGPTRARLLRSGAHARPADAAAALERMRALREAIYRVFSAIALENDPAPEDIGHIQAAAADAASRRRIVRRTEGQFHYEWPDSTDLEQLAWPVAVSAADLLVFGEHARIKECATDNCNWLFIDSSRNRSRRWCDMKDCGNRAKARRHYHRSRESAGNG